MRLFVPKCNRYKLKKVKPYTYQPYSEYLEGDHWRQTKLKSSRIYGTQCVVCQSCDNVEFHHTFYPQTHTNILAHQVIPLCSECHAAYHSSAPNGGIHENVREPQKIASIISEIFRHAKIGRGLDQADRKWIQLLTEREHRIKKTFWRLETNRHLQIP